MQLFFISFAGSYQNRMIVEFLPSTKTDLEKFGLKITKTRTWQSFLLLRITHLLLIGNW